MSSTDVARRPVSEILGTALEIDSLNEERLRLIKATVAKDATDAEVGMFLELSAKYDLDPFAHEIWCVKSQSRDGRDGRLMIMVGRDGLRKIAARSNIHLDGDVVHENDAFNIVRTPDGNRTVAHSYGKPHERGALIGAWAECRAGGPMGKPLGFFYAPLTEYKPTNEKKLQYSPWGSQESVMILAAAERQALRQATPLSGLLVEGETERNLELEAGADAPTMADVEGAIEKHVPEGMQDKAWDLISHMNRLAPNSWTASKVEMVFSGKTTYATSVELGAIERSIDELRARPAEPEVTDAEVVDEEIAQRMRVREARIGELEDALAGEDLSEQQRADAEAELDALTGERDATEADLEDREGADEHPES